MTPLPPPDLSTRKPLIDVIPKGSIVHRFYNNAYEPLFFDRSLDSRLNAPDRAYGVLYVAKEPHGAFAESFLRNAGATLLDIAKVRSKGYVRFEAAADIVLVKLAGPGLAILGATAEVTHGGLPYTAPQAWSKAIFEHPVNCTGISYYARHDDEELCYAIFDRISPPLREIDRQKDVDASWFWDLAAYYRVGLAPA